MNSRKKWICSLLTTAFVCSCSSFGSVGGVKKTPRKKSGLNSISGLLKINNSKGMGYKITDNMTLEVKTLLKFLSIISTQFRKCSPNGLNKFSISFRNKRIGLNSMYRSNRLIEAVSDFCKLEKNIKNLDIWYNALCRSACSVQDVPTYRKHISSKQDKGMFDILFAYRNWKPEYGEWNDYLKKVEKCFNYKLLPQELRSACRVQNDINRVAKNILNILDSNPKDSKNSMLNTWCPFRVFKIK